MSKQDSRALQQRLLQRAPRRLVELIAQALARSKPLAPEPGWHFDAGADDPSAIVQLRRNIWEYYHDKGISKPVTLRWYDGLRVRLFLGNDMSLCLYAGGSFEPNEFVLLDDVLEPGMSFIDGGANDGLYSVFAATRVGPSGTVLAVEPSGREYQRLLANLALNSNVSVTPVQRALLSAVGEATLAIAEEGHEGQNTIGQTVSNLKVAAIAHETVPATTIDALVHEHGLTRMDAIKLDVEGSEVDALLGAERTIERFHPLLLVEAETERLASQGKTKADLVGLLTELGYDLLVFDDTTGELRPVVTPGEPEGNVVAAPRGWRPPATH